MDLMDAIHVLLNGLSLFALLSLYELILCSIVFTE
jgi:hypothetical protein